MRVLLIGSGGREHALAAKLVRSPRIEALYAAPGNPGVGRHARCLPIAVDAHAELLAFADRERIDFTVVGPEAPLVAGLADRFAERGLVVLGPTAKAARLEGSKVFAKTLMARHGVPTARYASFEDPSEARRFCRDLGVPLVVKADGLAAGKGAIVCPTLQAADAAVATCLERRAFGAAGAVVVIEEFLEGQEVSYFVLANGKKAIGLGAAQDHKTVFDDDQGPNTGGMGAYSPLPLFDAALERQVMAGIVRPVLAGLAAEGAPYRGLLFCQLMLTTEGPKVVEFNCRLGDPEGEVVLARLQDDLLPLLLAAARGEPLPGPVGWSPEAAVCVVLASGDYPGPYPTGLPIDGVDAAENIPGVRVFHAGTSERDGKLVTAGGRVLAVTASAPTLPIAITRAYEGVATIHFEGMHYRRDIGHRALITP